MAKSFLVADLLVCQDKTNASSSSSSSSRSSTSSTSCQLSSGLVLLPSPPPPPSPRLPSLLLVSSTPPPAPLLPGHLQPWTPPLLPPLLPLLSQTHSPLSDEPVADDSSSLSWPYLHLTGDMATTIWPSNCLMMPKGQLIDLFGGRSVESVESPPSDLRDAQLQVTWELEPGLSTRLLLDHSLLGLPAAETSALGIPLPGELEAHGLARTWREKASYENETDLSPTCPHPNVEGGRQMSLFKYRQLKEAKACHKNGGFNVFPQLIFSFYPMLPENLSQICSFSSTFHTHIRCSNPISINLIKD
ncbi:unnamed protein product [Protopolystoma xenopodis]|uniref:Uncharacterized protein n=1 Tax=Protopolystoma xenopodis TaxID=117903 RepID=A0A448WH86_9PLAT|nr:unnamed protein product [Protopolystoma xenopodis]